MDSSTDTQIHISRVRIVMKEAIKNLLNRSIVHDASKLQEPEKSGYDQITTRLKDIAYGSEEYRASLKESKPTIQHHYEHNDHHPEHYGADGIAGMSLMALLEMVCDWKAASERHENGSIWKSLEINKTFQMSPQLIAIFEKTFIELGFKL